jgi:hypothetical protein
VNPGTPGPLLSTATITAPVGAVEVKTENNSVTETTPSSLTNDLTHGSRQVRSLAAMAGPAARVDWFRIGQAPQSSYEVVIDAASGDVGLGAGPFLERIGPDGTTVLQSSVAVGVGPGRRLAWVNTTTSVVRDQYIRVMSSQCTTQCGADDQYRLRSYDTTYSIPRFYNTEGQFSAVVIFNTGSSVVSGQVYFWSSSGSLLHTAALNLGPKGLFVLSASSVPALANTGGSVTVAVNGGYGELTGKVVTTEPSTGSSFDTLMEARPR